MSDWLTSYQENQQRSKSLPAPQVNSRQGAKTRPFDSLAWWVVLPSALEQSLPGTGGHTCSGYGWGSGVEREDGSRGEAGTG